MARLGGAADPDRWVTCMNGDMTKRLQVPKGATTWRFIEDAMNVAVNDVCVCNGATFIINTPSEIRDGDILKVNSKKQWGYCVVM